MSHKKFIVVFLLTAGCGGESFSGFEQTGTDGGSPVGETALPDANANGVDAGTGGAGGSTTIEAGGATAGDAGGAPGSGGSTLGEPEAGGTTATGGVTATGGTTSTGGTAVCAPVTHDNGIGQTWTDCVPLGVYDQAQAMKACLASGAGTCTAINRCGSISWEVDGYTTDGSELIAFWMYGGDSAGYVNHAFCGGPPCSGATETLTGCGLRWR